MTSDLTFELDSSDLPLEETVTQGSPQGTAQVAQQDSDALPEGTVMNPVDGQLYNLDDVDDLIRGCSDVQQQIADLRTLEHTMRQHAWNLSERAREKAGDKFTKGRRLRGKAYIAKLEQGDLTPNQKMLRETWDKFTEKPQVRDEFLKIASIGIKAREVTKLSSTSTTDPDLLLFKDMLKAALDNGSRGMPTLKQEK